MNILGKVLRLARLDCGYSQGEVADVLGVQQSVLSRFETGDRLPNKKYMRDLIELYDLNPDKTMALRDTTHAERQMRSLYLRRNQ